MHLFVESSIIVLSQFHCHIFISLCCPCVWLCFWRATLLLFFCFVFAPQFCSRSLCQVMNTNHRMLAKKHMMQFLCSQQTTINTSQINKQPTHFSKMKSPSPSVPQWLSHKCPFWNRSHRFVVLFVFGFLLERFSQQWCGRHRSEAWQLQRENVPSRVVVQGHLVGWRSGFANNSQKNLNEGHLEGPYPKKINIQSPETDR